MLFCRLTNELTETPLGALLCRLMAAQAQGDDSSLSQVISEINRCREFHQSGYGRRKDWNGSELTLAR
jgi:hypothetical protein